MENVCENCSYMAMDGLRMMCMIDVSEPIMLEKGFEDCRQFIPRDGEPLTLEQYQHDSIKHIPSSESQGRFHGQEGKKQEVTL